jgi:hypothetical protein
MLEETNNTYAIVQTESTHVDTVFMTQDVDVYSKNKSPENEEYLASEIFNNSTTTAAPMWVVTIPDLLSKTKIDFDTKKDKESFHILVFIYVCQ